MALSEGQTSGVAVAKIVVDVSGVRSGAAAAVNAVRPVTAAVNEMEKSAQASFSRLGSLIHGLAQRFNEAEASAKAFAKTDLGQLQQGLQRLAGAFAPISLAAGGLVAAGLAAGLRVQRLTALIRILSGTQEKAAARMEELRSIAERTGQSFLSVAESAEAILPAIGRNNVDLGKTLSLVQRLAVLDPTQGAQGAAFAIRELLSGEYISLAKRFELPRKALQDLLEEAQGAPDKIIEGLDKLVSGLGLTQESFEEMGKSGLLAFSRLQGVVTEALATAFSPLLNNVVLPLVTKFADLVQTLNETNPQLLQTASIFAVAAAGITPLLFALSQLISAYRTISRLGPGIKSALASPAVAGGLAAAGGLGIGLEVSKRLASAGVRSGDLGRIAGGEDAGQILLERLTQIVGSLVVVLATATIEIGRVIGQGAAILVTAFEKIGAVLGIAVNIIKEGFGSIQVAIGNVLVGLADAFSGLFDTSELRASGQGNQALGQANIESGRAERERLQGTLTTDTLTPRLNEINDFFNQARTDVVGKIGEFFGAFADTFVAGTEEVAAATSEMQEVEQQTNRLAELAAEHAEEIREVNEQIAELTQNFAEESARIAEQRQIDDTRSAFNTALTESRQQRDFDQQQAQTAAQFYDQQAADLEEYYAQTGEMQDQALAQQAQEQADFSRQQERDAIAHGLRLEQIERDTRLAVEQAAANLDATGVFNALQSGLNQTTTENQNYELARQQRQEDFDLQAQQLQTSLEEQSGQRESAFLQQQADQLVAFEVQRAATLAAFEQRQGDEAVDAGIRAQRQIEDRAREDALRQSAFDKQITKMQLDLAKQTGIGQAMIDNVTNALSTIGQRFSDFLVGVQNQANTLSAPSGQVLSGSAMGFAGGTRSVPQRRVVRLNEPTGRGPGVETAVIAGKYFARFTQPAQIFPVGAAGAPGQGSGSQINISGITQNFGDIGQHSEERIKELFREAMGELAAKAGGR